MDGRSTGAVSGGFGAASSVVVGGVRLEYLEIAGADPEVPTLVFLHEGLGSARLWKAFPADVARDTGARVLVYSRQGYGGSDPIPLPRPLTYMHDEGLVVLPPLLEALGVRDAVLVGHSDGGSISLIYAGSGVLPNRARGLVLLAPHVFCEDVSVASIRRAKGAYEHGDLKARLARHHGANTENAFRGWNDAWLDPGFKAWNIEAFLPGVHIPVLCLQGADDPYGTLAQVDAIARGVSGPCEKQVLAGCGHDPAREKPEETRAAIRAFVARLAPSARPATSAP